MTTAIPSRYLLLASNGGSEYAAREDIVGGTGPALGVAKCLVNGRWVYAAVNRRTLASCGHVGNSSVATHLRRPITTTSASYETIFEVPATLSTGTSTIELIGRGLNVDILVNCYASESVAGATFQTLTNNVGAVEGNLIDTGAIGANTLVTLEIQIKYHLASPGKLYGFRVFEQWLVSADLPA